MREVDPRLDWVNLLNIDETDFYRHWELQDGGRLKDEANSFVTMLRDYGLDLPLLNSVEGMTVGRSAVGWREMPNLYDTGLSIYGSQNPYHWWARTDRRVAEAYDDGSDEVRYVLIRNSWDENVVVGKAGLTKGNMGREVFLEGDRDWVITHRRTRTLPQLRGIHAREPLVQAIILSDPNLLLGAFLDLNVNVAQRDVLLPLVQVFTRLPRERFQPVLDTGLTTNFAIRRLVKDGRTWFYVANPGYWTMPGTVTITGGKGGVQDVVSGATVANAGEPGDISLTIPPYSMRAFVVDGEAEITGYATGEMALAEQAHMREMISKVRELHFIRLEEPSVDSRR